METHQTHHTTDHTTMGHTTATEHIFTEADTGRRHITAQPVAAHQTTVPFSEGNPPVEPKVDDITAEKEAIRISEDEVEDLDLYRPLPM